jgi:hypothetical protein
MKNTPHKAVINISTYFHKVEPTGEVSTPLSFSHNKEAGVKNFNILCFDVFESVNNCTL